VAMCLGLVLADFGSYGGGYGSGAGGYGSGAGGYSSMGSYGGMGGSGGFGFMPAAYPSYGGNNNSTCKL